MNAEATTAPSQQPGADGVFEPPYLQPTTSTMPALVNAGFECCSFKCQQITAVDKIKHVNEEYHIQEKVGNAVTTAWSETKRLNEEYQVTDTASHFQSHF